MNSIQYETLIELAEDMRFAGSDDSRIIEAIMDYGWSEETAEWILEQI